MCLDRSTHFTRYIQLNKKAIKNAKIKCNYVVKNLKKKLRDTEKMIDNLFRTIEAGGASEPVLNRLNDRQIEKEDLEKQISIEEKKEKGSASVKIKSMPF